MRLYINRPIKPTDGTEMNMSPVPVLLSDEAILSDHEIKNDAVLYVTFVKSEENRAETGDVPTSDDDWEEIDIKNACR